MIRKTLRFILMPLLAIALSVLIPRQAFTQTPNPILTLETGTHTGRMMRLAVDPAERFIATAAEDKTVRLWDISGEGAPMLMRILRPPMDPGAEGKLYSVAISHDGSTVACAGWTGWEWEGKTSIYLFDRATGTMKKRLTGFPGRVSHIAYSPDGRFIYLLNELSVSLTAFAWDAARREGLSGFVRNLPDGSVEAVVEGERDALDRFEWTISSGPRGARVDHVNRESGPATGLYQDFSIKG